MGALRSRSRMEAATERVGAVRWNVRVREGYRGYEGGWDVTAKADEAVQRVFCVSSGLCKNGKNETGTTIRREVGEVRGVRERNGESRSLRQEEYGSQSRTARRGEASEAREASRMGSEPNRAEPMSLTRTQRKVLSNSTRIL
jgi:hypothetical protein